MTSEQKTKAEDQSQVNKREGLNHWVKRGNMYSIEWTIIAAVCTSDRKKCCSWGTSF